MDTRAKWTSENQEGKRNKTKAEVNTLESKLKRVDAFTNSESFERTSRIAVFNWVSKIGRRTRGPTEMHISGLYIAQRKNLNCEIVKDIFILINLKILMKGHPSYQQCKWTKLTKENIFFLNWIDQGLPRWFGG